MFSGTFIIAFWLLLQAWCILPHLASTVPCTHFLYCFSCKTLSQSLNVSFFHLGQPPGNAGLRRERLFLPDSLFLKWHFITICQRPQSSFLYISQHVKLCSIFLLILKSCSGKGQACSCRAEEGKGRSFPSPVEVGVGTLLLSLQPHPVPGTVPPTQVPESLQHWLLAPNHSILLWHTSATAQFRFTRIHRSFFPLCALTRSVMKIWKFYVPWWICI